MATFGILEQELIRLEVMIVLSLLNDLEINP
jgi:hypothetical protein